MPLPPSSLFPPESVKFMKWPSRRSVVHSTKGMVACTQPLAAKCGIDILNAGGNAADAAVAVAAGMNMTEPCSTGIGGDMFCLYYDAATGKVSALNGSGRSGENCTLETIRNSLGLKDGAPGEIPMSSVHAVTVPGAAAGWVDTVEKFGSGKLTLEQILAPAIELGEKGFPLSEQTAHFWQKSEKILRNASPNYSEMLKRDPASPDGYRAPKAGEIITLPNLARTFRALATEGKAGFYTGRIANELVSVVQSLGGHLTLSDLEHHMSQPIDSPSPLSLDFTGFGNSESGVKLYEHPPNGQGIVALLALGILQQLESSGTIPSFSVSDHNSVAYLHAVIESLRIAFADATWFVTDPTARTAIDYSALLSKEYLSERAKLFSPTRASEILSHGNPSPALRSSDTVYFAVSDSQGNAISFINSNYGGFGTAIVPRGCGFTLQNRGSNFSLDEKHPNVLAPRKRPYHTIIPGLVTNLGDGSLHSVFGVMGGYMQPQGHVQVLLGQLVGKLNPQQALDASRICIGAGMADEGDVFDRTVYVEDGMGDEVVEGLRALGHRVVVVGSGGDDENWQARATFGRGQVIRWSVDEVEKIGIWSAGSDMRGDGGAYPA
ncbi:putative gamma-glutamyltransferase YwrD [Cladorrhinum samala]|uniref:Gamma-glutamyltransferase YwrD n=1 Tax=Cladorrhinum samala TaxID=585594 RepID=A0AAV9HLN7_9PEZI|nr:putative gamma-glutamyltransferase YwrD [Cladorrhinum samala]